MIELADDVELALVRGVGAYLRSTPATELPARLRRFRSFRPQALGRHRADLIGVLDDDTMRALIGEWIDDGHTSLKKGEAELLRLAVQRPEGWEETLARRSRPRRRTTTPDAAATTHRKLEQERERLRRAKKAEQEFRAELKAERAVSARLRSEIDNVRNEGRQAVKRADSAERARGRAEAALDRERRRAARAVEKGRAELERARAELKTARKEIAELRRRVASLERSTTEAPGKTKPSSRPRRSGPRRALPVPKGRLEDDPGTLEEWLDEPSVLLLVDGYNVTKSVGGFGDLDLERQRELLVDGVARLARRKKVHATVVFDGSDVAPGTKRRSKGGVRVEYSRPDEIADDHLIALLEGLPPDPVVLVTSDRELQGRAARLQATIASSPQLLALIR
ncbi:MAG: NYN domain-containing protein [Actinomycetota bacterium]